MEKLKFLALLLARKKNPAKIIQKLKVYRIYNGKNNCSKKNVAYKNFKDCS